MQDRFDPYYKWLGIPPRDQPPDHYRLLAVPQFESDPEVIQCAADQRMGHVRTFQNGRHGAASQKILNELAAARVCLLSPEKKAAYDRQRQSSLAAAAPPVPPVPPPPASTIPPSPPPPAQAPPVSRSPGQAQAAPAQTVHRNVATSSTTVFPPLDATLPDRAGPPVAIARVARSKRARRISLAIRTAGILLLIVASVVFWQLYRREMTPETIPDLQQSSTQPPLASSPSTGPADLSAPRSQEVQAAVAAARQPGSLPPDETIEMEQAATGPGLPPGPASPPADRPVEPPAAEVTDGMAATADEDALSAVPSLADLLEGVTPVPDAGAASELQSDDGLVTDEGSDKRVPPKPATLQRALARLAPAWRQADCDALLAESQNPDRPSPEVFALLELAGSKAVLAGNAEGALQAVDLLESKFAGNYDAYRVNALAAMLGHGKKKNDIRLSRHVANVAWKASQDALTAGNHSLAKSLGAVALQAAQASGPPTLQESLQAYVRGLD
ncbi:MAG: hypothetical protein ACYC6Y_07845 [Thermoguttaceae bacterium]